MSLSFFVAARSAPRFSAFVDVLAEPDWACHEDPPADDVWPSGYCFHPYLRGRAARGVELSHDSERFQVRIMTCSSRGDFELGIKIACTLSRMTGGLVTPPDGAPMSADDVARAFGPAWVDEVVTAGADAVLTMVTRDGGTLTMSGTKRDFHVGPRFAAELRARPGDLTAGEQLVAAMVRLQNVDEEEYYPAKAFRVTPQGRSAEDAFTLAVWGPGVAYLMPGVDYFAVPSDDGEVLLPHAAAPAVARNGDESRWRYLDEKNALVEATMEDEWNDLVARARSYAKRTFDA